ncbi:MAG: DUF3810 domain-containing protein [Acetatifactor sp.]|nr:DUF3810 domain-containing protein [Acetatifactor sp.]
MAQKRRAVLYLSIAILTVLLNILAWSSTAFCDAYVTYVFPLWTNTYGRLMGIFPFSVGEWMLILGIVLILVAVFTAVSVLFLSWHSFARLYLRFCAWVLVCVCLIMTLNCSMLYHVTPFSQQYLGGAPGEYSLEELLSVRNFVASQCNRLSGEVLRDERGDIIYPGDDSALQKKACQEMEHLGADYGRLRGYYPRPKPLFFSDFMCQQNMLGWYFPFSMEANYNRVAYVMNQPASMCHELAHLKGFIYEDEANFIAYLACVQSDDIYFEYSGYLSVLGYLEHDLRSAAAQDPERFKQVCALQEPLKLLDVVYEDARFVTEEEWERIEGKALLDTETVDKATDVFLDTTLKANGVSDGTVSYSHVVKLLLQYYSMKRD